MTFLVDANVLSETTRADPSPNAIAWLRRNERELVVDPVILGEIRFGINLLPAGVRRRRLEKWFDGAVVRISCVPWEANTGLRWAKLLSDLRRSGRSVPIKDSMIAATALLHGFTIATRNTRDFDRAGVKVIDPFR